MYGLLLYVVAVLLRIFLFPVGFAVGVFKSFHQHHFATGLKLQDKKLLFLAISIDAHGNVICADLFNLTLVKRKPFVSFGQWGQTISAVLGHNERAGTLTFAGRALCFILNWFDRDHTYKAAELDKYKPNAA
jgi:hypothetical protein